MADGVAITAGSGTTIFTDDLGASGHAQYMKLLDGTNNSALVLNVVEDQASAPGDPGIVAMARRTDTPATTTGTDGDYEALQVSGGLLWVRPLGLLVQCQTDITRPADTAVYTAGDALSDSTSAPTSGGFTLTGAARVSGGAGVIMAMNVSSSNDPATRLSGEIFIFNTSVTNVNDNAAFAVSDTEIKTLIGVVPFSLFDAGNNGFATVSGINLPFVTSGSANLRFLVRVRNAYTPASAEAITVTAFINQVN